MKIVSGNYCFEVLSELLAWKFVLPIKCKLCFFKFLFTRLRVMLFDQWMLWSLTVALPASSPSIAARSTTASRSLTSTTLPSCRAPAPWVAWIWFALVWTFMNLYGHVGLVLYGPSFVALHLNLYELVRTCMDCGLYKMFSDAYYDVWTILWSICEIYELHEMFIWFGVPYMWLELKKTKKAFLPCAMLLGHTAKRTSTSCVVTLPFFAVRQG